MVVVSRGGIGGGRRLHGNSNTVCSFIVVAFYCRPLVSCVVVDYLWISFVALLSLLFTVSANAKSLSLNGRNKGNCAVDSK